MPSKGDAKGAARSASLADPMTRDMAAQRLRRGVMGQQQPQPPRVNSRLPSNLARSGDYDSDNFVCSERNEVFARALYPQLA
jgi:hypothetical protein